ncbi:hypothetical protein H7170_00365 [Candidatus Gracilibacteria bacterium]|nr:hypothetical protein [Candidatus Gracilibacteria bacterium]
MAITNVIHEPFAHTDVATIVTAIHERLGTTEGLKDTVLSELLEILNVRNIPERVQSWVHRYCLLIISPDIPVKEFTGKLADPIDLASLSRR